MFALESRIHLQEGIMKRSKSAVLTVTVAPLIDRNGGVAGSVAFKFSKIPGLAFGPDGYL